MTGTTSDTAAISQAEDITRSWRLVIRTLGRLEGCVCLTSIGNELTRAARELVGADGASFVVREGELCHYVTEDAIGPLWKGLRFPLTSCISGWAMRERQTAVVSDISIDERIPHSAYQPTFVKSLIMTPVGGERPDAAIGFYWSRKRSFDDATVLQAQTLATAAAPVIALRQAAAALLLERERRFLVPESFNIGLWELDVETLDLRGSALFKSHFGRRIDDPFTYRDLIRSLTIADQSRLQEALRLLIRNGTPFAKVVRARWPDGTEMDLELVASSEGSASSAGIQICGGSRVVKSTGR